MSAERKDPYLGYRFRVEIDALLVAGFAEVSGLQREVQTQEYEEGGVNDYTHTLPTRVTHSNVTLRRGLTDSTELWDWLQASVDRIQIPAVPSVQRKNVRIVLQDGAGKESWGWELRDAYPVSWEGPELQADQGSVAMEALELAHRGITGLEGVPS